MKVHITRNVPGYTDMRALAKGDIVELPQGLAVSLVNDGYAEVVRENPAEKRETADNPPSKRAPGRPRKA